MAKKKENCDSCEKKKMVKGGAVDITDKPTKEKKPNPWLEHVKKHRAENPGMPYKQCLQEAKKTYKKGGVISLTPSITPNPEPEPVKKMKQVKKGGNVEAKPAEKPLEIKKEPAVPVKKMKKVKKVKKVNFEK
jgi:hypothetical protein